MCRIYRAKILFALNKDLKEEIEWLNKVSLKYLKNYQIWFVSGTAHERLKSKHPHSFLCRHHRQVLMSSREHFPTLPAQELDFLKEMFAQDSKNYHVWTYRHWLVRHFQLWDTAREIQDVEALIDADVRNNSAWNHRFVLRFGPRTNEPDAGMPNCSSSGAEKGRLSVVDEDMIDAELQYAQSKILLAPQNQSPWSYARGVLRAAGRPLAEWKEFASNFVTQKNEAGNGSDFAVKSSHAIEWLADVYAEQAKTETKVESTASRGLADEAVKMLTLLKDKYDPIRKNYWDYRIRMLAGVSASA